MDNSPIKFNSTGRGRRRRRRRRRRRWTQTRGMIHFAVD